MIKDIADQRSPTVPGRAYSAYCHVCWCPIYILWADNTDHESKCIEGCDKAADCHTALQHSRPMLGPKIMKNKTVELPGE